jgi:predicted acylesterase/phospholipase RssA
LAGTSAGSFNAAYIVAKAEQSFVTAIDRLETIWVEGIATDSSQCRPGAVRIRANLLEWLDPRCIASDPLRLPIQLAEDAVFFGQDWLARAVNFVNSQHTLVRRLLELIDLGTFFSLQGFRRILQRDLSLEAIRRSRVLLRIAATDWYDGALRLFANEDMTEAEGVDIVMASSAFPGLPPVYIGGEPYVDGGYLMTTPLSPAIDAGANVVHVIYLDPDVSAIPIRRLQNTVDVIDRMFVIFRADIFNRDIANAESINKGLSILESQRQPSDNQLKQFVQVADRLRAHLRTSVPYRKMTIHRYHPQDDLGGVLGLVNFDRDQIAALIQRGYEDAVRHDCKQSQCVLPS